MADPVLAAASATLAAHRELTALWRAQAIHHRSMYLACFRAGCDLASEVARLERMVTEMREERARYARTVFGPQGASDE